MATMVCRVTPTFSASAAWVISPAWKRSVRIVLLICACPLPMASAEPVVDEAGDSVGDAGKRQRREEDIRRAERVSAHRKINERGKAADGAHDIGVPHAAGVDRAVPLVGALVLELLAAGDADEDRHDDRRHDVEHDDEADAP